MKVIAAYLRADLGGNATPSGGDLKAILSSVGAEADNDTIELLLTQVEGKDITELIASGREKLAFVPAGGGAVPVSSSASSGAAVPAATEAKKEEKAEEKEESDDVNMFGVTLFVVTPNFFEQFVDPKFDLTFDLTPLKMSEFSSLISHVRGESRPDWTNMRAWDMLNGSSPLT